MTVAGLDYVQAAVAQVDGWLSPDQIARLFQAARSTRRGDQIVEIGSFRGRSTIVIARSAPPGVSIVAIDPHAGNDRGPNELAGYAPEAELDHDAFLANLAAAGVADRVHHVRESSNAAHRHVDGSIAVLFIDGAHRFAPARADIRDWGGRVSAAGTLLVHDAFSSIGVTLAIARELLLGRRFRYVGRSRSLAEYRADLDGGFSARLLNAARQLAQLPWFLKNLAVKLLISARCGPLVARLTGRQLEWPY